jgi:hypothetical protein
MHIRNGRYKVLILLSILLAIGGAWAVFEFKFGIVDKALHARAASALLMTPPFIGAAVLFLAGFGHFKAKMRQAYTLFAWGILLFGIAMIQLPIIGLRDLWESWWANSGLVVAPFIFATSFIYLGIQRFALLLGIKNKLTDWRLLFSSALAFTLASFFGGHYLALYADSVDGLDIYIAIVAWSVVCITFAALLGRQVIDRIGPLYQPAMRWLTTGLLALSFAAWHEYIINYFTNNDTWYIAYGISFWPFIVSGLIMLRAGYAFTLIGATLPYIPVKEAPETAVSSDMQYANNLASLMALVSAQDSDVVKEAQTAAQMPTQQAAVQSYNKLENYLMNQDPLRRFDQEEIRGQLSPGFRALIDQQRSSDSSKN